VPGRLITLEGIDGSGKSTLLAPLAAALRGAGHDVRVTREPTDSPTGQALRQSLRADEHDALAEAFLFLADHAAHARDVRRWLARGQWVVSDRWGDSCLAYQGASLEGVVRDPLAWLERAQEPIALRPDCVLLLDLAPERAVERLAGRAEREKFERAAFLARVRRNYLDLAKRRGFEVLDAALPPDALRDEAMAALRRRGVL
jgi:dTMP kinase